MAVCGDDVKHDKTQESLECGLPCVNCAPGHAYNQPLVPRMDLIWFCELVFNINFITTIVP